MERFDVVIIGAGTGGQTAAQDLASKGCRVAVVEASSTPGGVCALRGCQAKKWFYEVTDAVARCNHLKGLGITSPPTVNWQDVLAAKNDFTSRVPANTIKRLREYNVTYFEGWAKLHDATTVHRGGTPLTADYIIIATGADTMKLSIPGAEALATSTDFLDLHTLPERIVFVGGGFISFEFAHFAARLGAKPGEIHILEAQDRPLGPFDSEMVEQLVAASEADGIHVHTGVSVASINKKEKNFSVKLASGRSIETDLVVNGAGRVANIASLNLEAVGVKFSRRGIGINEKMQTSIPNIFAIGDCAESIQLARVADKEAHVAAANIIAAREGSEHHTMDYRCAPAVLFSYPQLAMVGKTEDELKKDGIKYRRSFQTNVQWPTYRRIGMKHAAYKLLVDERGRILGGHILSDNATGLINMIKQAMMDNMSVADLHEANILSPFPSRESDIIYMLSPLLD